MRLIRALFLTLFGVIFSFIPATSLELQVEQGETLKVRSQGETLFEVAPLGEEALAKVKKFLTSPPKGAKVVADGPELEGLPVKLVVTPDIAKRWKSEPKGLARLFSERLSAVLSDAPPTWSVSGQVVPLSESRTVSLSPFRGDEDFQVSSDNPEVVSVESLGQGEYRLNGLGRGRASILASSSKGALEPLPVSVKPWAARWEQGPGRLHFWGDVSDERLNRSVYRWLAARTMIGARFGVQEVDDEDEQTRAFTARAEGPDALPVETTFKVKVEKSPPTDFEPARYVALSNHPERIHSDGVLFQRTVPTVPFRFMWHHRNDPSSPERYVVLQLTNPTGVTRRLRVLWYGYGPSPDEIHVGHTAALDYAKAGINRGGEELILPAGGTRTVEIRYVKPGQTVSGMAYLSDIGSEVGPIEVTVLATTGDGPLPTEPAVSKDPGRTASGVFAATIESDATHLLGGPFTYLSFGGEPYEKDIEGGYPSYGNFGTVYRTRLMLKNPTPETRQVTVGFASGGGAARGVLSLDGALFDLPMGITGEGLPVQTYTLGPEETRQVDVELFPQAGSNYPVRLVVRSEYERREQKEAEAQRPLRPAIP